MLALCGLTGLGCGNLLYRIRLYRSGEHSRVRVNLPVVCHWPSLSVLWACAFGVTAVTLVALHAPTATIMREPYERLDEPYGARVLNFAASHIVGFTMLNVLMIDLALSGSRKASAARFVKAVILAGCLSVSAVWLQLLRGDRDVFGLVLSSALIFAIARGVLRWPRAPDAARPGWWGARTCLILAAAGAGAFVVLQTFGAWRSQAYAGISFGGAMVEALQDPAHGTWSGVLLTAVSTVGDLYYGRAQLSYGRYYVDVLASLPPGPIAKLFGYERAIDSTKGLNWTVRYSLGGLHILCAPVLSFSAPGVFLVLGVFGWFVGALDRQAERLSRRGLLLACAMANSLAGWVWYGDMYAVRAIMAGMLVWWLYELALRTRSRTVVAPRGESHVGSLRLPFSRSREKGS